MQPYQPDRGLAAKVERRVVQWRQAAPVTIQPDRPMLSITFDDCPKSAAVEGARLLDKYAVRACYYVASGLMGTDSHMGRMADRDDLQAVFDDGHEIGAHTHSHIDCSKASESEIIADIDRNMEELSEITRGAPVASFAFPFGETTFQLKQKLADRFGNLRGILSGNNRGRSDRAQLHAFELDGSEFSVERAVSALQKNAAAPGWTILFTHDVSETPSGFGVSPDQLVRLIEFARDKSVDFVTPSEASSRLGFPVQ